MFIFYIDLHLEALADPFFNYLPAWESLGKMKDKGCYIFWNVVSIWKQRQPQSWLSLLIGLHPYEPHQSFESPTNHFLHNGLNSQIHHF